MQTCKVASQRHASFPSTGTPSLLPGTSLRQILTLESSLQEASLSPGKVTIDKLIKIVITIIIILEFSPTLPVGSQDRSQTVLEWEERVATVTQSSSSSLHDFKIAKRFILLSHPHSLTKPVEFNAVIITSGGKEIFRGMPRHPFYILQSPINIITIYQNHHHNQIFNLPK